LLTGQTPSPPPQNCRGLQGYGYCWTHGVVQHDGNTCRTPKEGHIKEATLANPQGGRLHIGKNKGTKKKCKTPGPPKRSARHRDPTQPTNPRVESGGRLAHGAYPTMIGYTANTTPPGPSPPLTILDSGSTGHYFSAKLQSPKHTAHGKKPSPYTWPTKK
jgi:hypothetical protein